jgi:transcriptional regulator with XRE-family HTH domain
MKDFAQWLDECMKIVGLTNEALASKIRVSKMTIYNWRSGKIQHPSSREKLLKCADVLELTPTQRAEFFKAAGHLPKKDEPPPQPIPVIGIPIIQPSQFFGRENILGQIYWAWDKTVPESITIIGPKRSGKTSLLNYLNNITQTTYLRPDQPKAWPDNWLPHKFKFALVDFQDANMSQPETLVKEILQQLKLEVPQTCDIACFSSIIKRELTKPTVILMDNIEIGIAALDTAFWQNMCSLGSHGKLSFVVTALKELEQCDKLSSFFNLFGHTLHLGALTESEARELLANSPKPFSPEEIERMLKESNCWPEPLQKLCDRRLQQLLLEKM